jgi:hypothetical protein
MDEKDAPPPVPDPLPPGWRKAGADRFAFVKDHHGSPLAHVYTYPNQEPHAIVWATPDDFNKDRGIDSRFDAQLPYPRMVSELFAWADRILCRQVFEQTVQSRPGWTLRKTDRIGANYVQGSYRAIMDLDEACLVDAHVYGPPNLSVKRFADIREFSNIDAIVEWVETTIRDRIKVSRASPVSLFVEVTLPSGWIFTNGLEVYKRLGQASVVVRWVPEESHYRVLDGPSWPKETNPLDVLREADRILVNRACDRVVRHRPFWSISSETSVPWAQFRLGEYRGSVEGSTGRIWASVWREGDSTPKQIEKGDPNDPGEVKALIAWIEASVDNQIGTHKGKVEGLRHQPLPYGVFRTRTPFVGVTLPEEWMLAEDWSCVMRVFGGMSIAIGHSDVTRCFFTEFRDVTWSDNTPIEKVLAEATDLLRCRFLQHLVESRPGWRWDEVGHEALFGQYDRGAVVYFKTSALRAHVRYADGGSEWLDADPDKAEEYSRLIDRVEALIRQRAEQNPNPCVSNAAEATCQPVDPTWSFHDSPLRNSPMPNLDTVKKTLQADAVDAAWRTAASQFVKLTREPLVAVLSRHIAPNNEGIRAKIAEFLQTEAGTAMLGAFLAIGLMSMPARFGDTPERLSRELRVKSMSEIADLVVDVFAEPLRLVMASYLQGLPNLTQEIRAELLPAASEPSVPTEKVETRDPVEVES